MLRAELAALRDRMDRLEDAQEWRMPLDLCSSCGARALARIPAAALPAQFGDYGPHDHVQWCLACTYWQEAEPMEPDAAARKRPPESPTS